MYLVSVVVRLLNFIYELDLLVNWIWTFSYLNYLYYDALWYRVRMPCMLLEKVFLWVCGSYHDPWLMISSQGHDNYIQEKMGRGAKLTSYIASNQQVADVMTKPLSSSFSWSLSPTRSLAMAKFEGE